MIIDQKNLEYFLTTKKLSERHVQWILRLNKYNLKIKYRLKKKQRTDRCFVPLKTKYINKCFKWMNTISYVSIFSFRLVWRRILRSCVNNKRVNDELKWWPQIWSFIFVSIWEKRHCFIHNQHDEQFKWFLKNRKNNKHHIKTNKKNHCLKFTKNCVWNQYKQNIIFHLLNTLKKKYFDNICTKFLLIKYETKL